MDEQQVIDILWREIAKLGFERPDDPEPPKDIFISKFINEYPHNSIKTHWPTESKWWTFHPMALKKGCLYMGRDYLTIAMTAIRDSDNGTPLVLTDSCSFVGDCIGHNGLHSADNLKTFDGCYPTLSSDDVENPLSAIYTDTTRTQIDPEVFDWKRFVKLVIEIRKHSPNALIMCGNTVWQYIKEQLGDKWIPWFKANIQHYDLYNHNTHWHVTLGKRVIL